MKKNCIMGIIRQKVLNAARSHYWFFKILRSSYRTAKYFTVIGKVRMRMLFGCGPGAFGASIISVDPAMIKRWSAVRTCKYSDIGIVKGGNWDQNGVDIVEHCYYESIRDTVKDLSNWEKTPLYFRLSERCGQGEIAQGIRSELDLKEMGSKIKALYDDIRHNGFKRPSELVSVDMHPLMKIDDVAVNIGRDGQIILVDGGHRVVIAKLLKLSSIPVRVCVRHSEWVEFKGKLKGFASFNKNKTYQRIEHPDLMDIECVHGDGRYEMIKSHLPDAPKRVLDIGSNWGYFCHKLEDDGHRCTAVENDPEHFYFLKCFKDINGKKFRIVNQSILSFNDTDGYDVVLALNIFHHFIKYRESHDQLADYLNVLKAEMILFQPHLTTEFDGMNYYKNYTNEEFVQFVMKHARKTTSECIGRASDGRPIYKLT